MTEALEIRTPHTDVSDVVRELAPAVDDLSIRLPCERPIADGEWVRFMVQLADGTTVFEGIGRSQGTRPEGPRYRVHLSLLQFDERNEVMYERMLLARDAEAERTGQFDLEELGAELVRGASRSAPPPPKSAPPALPGKSKPPIAPRAATLPAKASAPPRAKSAPPRPTSQAPLSKLPPSKPPPPSSNAPIAPPRPAAATQGAPRAPQTAQTPKQPAAPLRPASPKPAAAPRRAAPQASAPAHAKPAAPKPSSPPPAAARDARAKPAAAPSRPPASAPAPPSAPHLAGAADEEVTREHPNPPAAPARSAERPPRRRRRQRIPVEEPELPTFDTVISRPEHVSIRAGVSLQVPPRLVERARALAPTLPRELAERGGAPPEEAVLHAALRLGLASLAALADDDES